jgi:glucose/arabinose dehydrogenase
MADRCAWLAVAMVALVAAPVSAQLRGEIIVRGLQNPVAIVADPTDRSTYFIVEQRGVIYAARDGQLLEAPFLDLREAVSSGGERGLLGLAFAPDYAESRRLFVNFTNRDGHTVVARFTRRVDNAWLADPSSRFDLMWPNGRRIVEQPFSNHNGGHLLFGPDGFLYIGLGDGGSAGDPMNHAQRPDSLLGKMLRIDVDVPDEDARGYRVPEDNPFAGNDPLGALDEIWAFGLRNPWRYSFDAAARGGTSALVIADVGQNAREEINFEPAARAGRNYGWRLREGRQAYDDRSRAAFLPLTEPIHDYDRTIGASITGGFMYRGAALDPSYEGRYFYADFVSGRVFSIGLHLDAAGEARADDEREHTSALGGRDTLGMVSSFTEDHDGELLLLNYTAGFVVRVVPDLSVVPAAPVSLTARFDADQALLMWNADASGVMAVEYAIERLRDGRVEERVIVEPPQASVVVRSGDCFRVRARARNGSAGPATAEVCTPEP